MSPTSNNQSNKIKDLFKRLKILKSDDDEDDDQNFIRKDDIQDFKTEIEEENKSGVNPKNNQTRTLNTEVGGLESKEKKEISSKDEWDDRSEEVEEMGKSDVFNTSGMRSVVWKKKKSRLKNKKLEEEHGGFENMSHADKVKHREENSRNGGGTSR